jgi:death-on-curing protein
VSVVWVGKAVVLAIHEEQLAEHGGPLGLRDDGLPESALARPRHLLAYGQPSIADLAAAYAFGIVRNHPFVDGNKRVALVVTELFLDLNGHELLADDTDCVLTWRALADGELPERDLSTWISERLA